MAVHGDHDVVGLEIPVDDALGMGAGKAVGDRCRDRQRSCRLERTLGEKLAERLAVDELHRDERRSVVLVDVVDGDDGRMIERRRRSCFPLEATEPLRIGRELVGQDFDRGFTPELGVLGAVDLAHPTGTE